GREPGPRRRARAGDASARSAISRARGAGPERDVYGAGARARHVDHPRRQGADHGRQARGPDREERPAHHGRARPLLRERRRLRQVRRDGERASVVTTMGTHSAMDAQTGVLRLTLLLSVVLTVLLAGMLPRQATAPCSSDSAFVRAQGSHFCYRGKLLRLYG